MTAGSPALIERRYSRSIPSFVTSHGGITLGVTHRNGDKQRNCYYRSEVIGEPCLVANRLEPQCYRLGWSPENGSCDGIGQTNTRGTNAGWEQFGFNECIDRCVACDNHPGGRNQKKRAEGSSGCLQRSKQ